MEEVVQPETFDGLHLVDESVNLDRRDTHYLILDDSKSGWTLKGEENP